MKDKVFIYLNVFLDFYIIIWVLFFDYVFEAYGCLVEQIFRYRFISVNLVGKTIFQLQEQKFNLLYRKFLSLMIFFLVMIC